MSLQERVLAVLQQQTRVLAKEIGALFPDVERVALDYCLNGLMRESRVSLAGAVYSLPQSHIAAFPSGISPPGEKRVCVRCHVPKYSIEFRLLENGARAKCCNTCRGKKIQAGQVKRRERQAKVPPDGSEPSEGAQ